MGIFQSIFLKAIPTQHFVEKMGRVIYSVKYFILGATYQPILSQSLDQTSLVLEHILQKWLIKRVLYELNEFPRNKKTPKYTVLNADLYYLQNINFQYYQLLYNIKLRGNASKIRLYSFYPNYSTYVLRLVVSLKVPYLSGHDFRFRVRKFSHLKYHNFVMEHQINKTY